MARGKFWSARVTVSWAAAILTVFVGIAATTPQACAAVDYTVLDLGTLGGSFSCAYAINSIGQVARTRSIPAASNVRFARRPTPRSTR